MPLSKSTPIPSQVEPTWIGELDSQLQRVFTPGTSFEALEFPDILIQTLLSSDTPLDAEGTDRIVPIITQDIESITKTLHPTSLRTLASLLLRSCSQRARIVGFDLLLQASKIPRPGSEVPRIHVGKSDKPLVDQVLVRCLYQLFNDGYQEASSRRLAGKLLLAVMANLDDIADASLGPSQAELSRTRDILTHGTDKVLMFLASTILASFRRCGIRIPNTPQAEHKFLEFVKSSPEDKIMNYYHREIQQTKTNQHANQNTQECYLFRSLHVDETLVAIYPIGASLSAHALTLIYAVDNTSGRGFDYLEVPLRVILEVSADKIDSISSLVLSLDTSMMQVNERSDVRHGSKLRLSSKESLRDFETAIHAACGSRWCDIQEGIPITRKASSTLISLDFGNEIVRKSARPNDVGQDMVPDHKLQFVANGQPANHVLQGAGETVCNEELGEGDQRQAASENVSTSVHQDGVPENSEVQSSLSREHREQSQCLASQVETVSTGAQIETGEAEGKVDPQGVQNIDVVPAKEALENAVENADQDARRSLPYRLRSLSSKTKPLCQFTNTQESLMFHRRRHGQKVYTSHSKAAVDWDEDLQPSSDNHDGTAEKETITSVSSPFPGDGFIFDRRASTGKRKRDPAGKAFSKKQKKTLPRPRKKNVATTAASDKRPRASHPGKRGRKTDDAGCDGASYPERGNSCSKSQEDHVFLTSRSQKNRERADLDTAQGTPTTLKATDQYGISELAKDGTGSDRGVEVAPEENVEVGHGPDKSPYGECEGSLVAEDYGRKGRGKAVGRKLAAALKDLDTQGSKEPSERSVCDELSRRILPLSASDEGLDPVHATALSGIHGDSIQKSKYTLPRPLLLDPLWSQSPRPDVRIDTDGPDNPTQSTVFCNPAHFEVPRAGESRTTNEAGHWESTLSADQKIPDTTTGDNGGQDMKTVVQHRSLLRELWGVPAPFLQRRRSTPKRMVVDKNGSPQMIRCGATGRATPQESSIQSKAGMRMKPFQLLFQGPTKGNESGYDGGSETDATEEAPERDALASSSPLGYTSPASPLLERAAAPAGTLDGLKIDPVAQTDSKSTYELLETAHQRTQRMLLASSQRLACQLEDEKKAVNRVLEAYQRQCHQVLDELFKTQEERMRLCEQQAESIRTHHARICQELIDRLEVNGRMALKRPLPDAPASQGSERSKDAVMDHD